MSSWNIQPAEVGGVLTTVADHLGEEGGGDGLVGHITKVGEYVNLCVEEVFGGPVEASLAEDGKPELTKLRPNLDGAEEISPSPFAPKNGKTSSTKSTAPWTATSSSSRPRAAPRPISGNATSLLRARTPGG
ncbi:DUF6507 family protein [Nocardiopsis tropica]|uniref:DUF6507 family protein n=1 Tax=Nocardiopsis tropica TaxID=109330 RepID=A0ABV1ZUC6_9ACTN